MGQMMNVASEKLSKNSEETSERVPYDENDENGMIIENHYIPPEIWSEIFINFLDGNTLLRCQLVCKRWNDLLKSYIWRKKAEIVNRSVLPHKLQWQDYHLMYTKKPFNRNLIKNHSGEEGSVDKHWTLMSNGGDGWIIESPPAGVPALPEDPFFGPASCFVTSYYQSMKQQTIDLVQEGLPASILDNYKPKIIVSEWYSCRWDCPAVYCALIELLNDRGNFLKNLEITESLDGSKQNVWLKHSHTFENYGEGARKIRYVHGGKDSSFWAGHYGSKMTRACIIVESFTEIKEDSTDDLILDP